MIAVERRFDKTPQQTELENFISRELFNVRLLGEN